MTDTYLDLTLRENDIKLKVVDNGDGTYSLQVKDISTPVSEAEEEAGYTTPTTAIVAVGTASTLLIAANADRKYLLLDNVSDATIYLGFGGAAILASGVHLLTNGSYEMLNNALYKGAIYGITVAGTKDIVVLEGE